jgi:flavin prenyltransferase
LETKAHSIMVGITGASGGIYAAGLLAVLHELGCLTHICLTDNGAKVLKYECGYSPEDFSEYGKLYDNQDLFSGPSSGTYPLDGMVIIPCSTTTLGKISVGIADTLINRVAGVMLKERKPLVLVPREMPYSLPHLESMVRLTQAGAVILSASPGFYTHPQSISDLVSQVITKVLDQLHISSPLTNRWEDGGIHLQLD